MPKERSQVICLSVALIDSIFRADKNIILNYFERNAGTLLKKKRFTTMLQKI